MALHFSEAAARNQSPVLFFSLEMADYKLTDRSLIGEANIDSYNYHHASVNQIDYNLIHEKAAYLSNLKIYYDEKSGIDVDYIVSASRLAKRKLEIELIIIDYLQLIDMRERPGQTRDQAIGNVTRKLKQLSKEIQVPIILLSQLNRSLEGRQSKEPNLSDLRESGNIEQDADVVLMLFRPAYYHMEQYANKPTDNVLWILTQKYRNGAKTDIAITHNNTLTKFSDSDRTDF
jgi:replicative DNA helicase